VENPKLQELEPKQHTIVGIDDLQLKSWNLQLNIAVIICLQHNIVAIENTKYTITKTKNYATMHRTSTWKEDPQQGDTQHDVARRQLNDLTIFQI
jgi:hypothetical protein